MAASPAVIWRTVSVLLLGLFAGAIVWMAGFAAFERMARYSVPPPPPSDGIVALTGGAGRVEAALRLLAEGKAPLLLISGVGGKTELAGLGPDVTIGRAAADTIGNAAETAAWVRRNGIHTLIVVTAGYHMARALREIARELPDVELRPAPVRPPALRGRDGLAVLRLLATEFNKYLVAASGLPRLLPRGSRA